MDIFEEKRARREEKWRREKGEREKGDLAFGSRSSKISLL